MEIDARIGTPAKGWSVMLERKPGCKQAMVAWLHLGTAPVVPRDEFYEWLEAKP